MKSPILPPTNKWGIFSKWTIKKMVFVGILIAVSVALTIFLSSGIPAAYLPQLKFSIIGLPVKITGFIFGPIIGFLVGLLSDIISMFFIVPTLYSPLYTLATAMNGLVSGIIGWFFMHFLKFYFDDQSKIEHLKGKIFKLNLKFDELVSKEEFEKSKSVHEKIIKISIQIKNIDKVKTESQLRNVCLIISVFFLSLLIVILISVIGFELPDSAFVKLPINNRWMLLTLTVAGFATMMIFLTITRFKLNKTSYLIVIPIVIFSALLEITNVPILAIGDASVTNNGGFGDIVLWIFSHTLISPVKIWINLLIIYYSYSIVSKLIYKNENLGY
ncbi:ECF transporter S component [Mycoplasma anserisalpingitidis]|uniref:ECF transporter S component n=1 Tax=Mycoplasma anserisalpingitidis TaxID=519450 RepID=A0A5B8JB28_9MOLU|nr:ECF transporter S component [Mycoplasma anserisalpingitidis]QDY88292.1 ECF transporter S component [Mycoplasma anserisalpingitidis]